MKIRKILFPTDFLEGSEQAVPYAIDLAKKYEAKIYIIHIIHDILETSGLYVPHVTVDELYDNMELEAEKEIKRAYLEKLRGFDNVEYIVKRGIPYEEIIRFSEENGIDLIVMATHGRRGFDRILFGSTAEKVIKTAKCPVLTIREKKSSS